MGITFFRPRDRFDFAKDTLDIGNPITWERSHFLKHLFKRIFSIDDTRIKEFYQRHFAYYLRNHPKGSEEDFFKYLWELIEGQLKVLISKDLYDKNHVRNQREIRQLKKFIEVLTSYDRWNFHNSNVAAVAKQQSENYELTQQIAMLKAELRIAKRLETKQYIDIPKGHLLTVFDLFIQMLDLKIKGNELVVTNFPIVWVKLICKYFRVDKEEIDIERVRSYFPKDRENPGGRSRLVPMDQKIFEIKPKKR